MASESYSPFYKIISPIIAVIFVIMIFASFFIVGPGERAILITLGKASDISYEPGIHLKFPLVQKAVTMDVKTQKYEAEASAASSDLQTVTTKLAINYRLEPDSVPALYKEIGLDYSNKIIQPLEQEIVKATTAQFSAEELITKREAVREQMKNALTEKLRPSGIIVEEVSIVNFDFSESFNQAIEAKVTAEQNALAAKNKLEQIKYEAEQRVTAAQGEAEAIRIQTEAIESKGGGAYVQLQAIQKWNGMLPQVNGGAIPFISIQSGGNSTY